jgi:thimet oligopeptidase
MLSGVQYFHEFGHVCHHLLSSATRLHRFASFRVEQDFVEAPSQMLENWCWVPSLLQRLSGHWQDLSRKLPDDMARTLAASRIAHAGLFNTRQVFLATFDQRLHTIPAPAEGEGAAPAKVDTEALLRELHETILGIPMTPGSNFAASFGHLAGGYDSAYYGTCIIASVARAVERASCRVFVV